MKKKVKRYQDGGMTYQDAPMQNTNPQAPSASSGYFSNTASSYPFQSSGSSPSATDTGSGSGVNQTFNIQPSAQSGQPATTMKRGGKVKSASSRGDGCAIRGKTRA